MFAPTRHEPPHRPTQRLSAWVGGCVGLSLSVCVSAWAQTANPKTLGDMISQSKRQHEAKLFPAPPPIKRSAGPAPNNTPPMLWSLTGSNLQLVAEVLYRETVYVLRLHEGERDIGPWVVQRYGPQGLHLAPAMALGGSGKNEELFLPAPHMGTSLSRYAPGLPARPDAALADRAGLPPMPATGNEDIVPPQVLRESGNAMGQDAPPLNNSTGPMAGRNTIPPGVAGQ